MSAGPILPSTCRHLPRWISLARFRHEDRSSVEKVHTINFVHTCGDAPKAQIIPRMTNRERHMKHFMIKYEFRNGTTEVWHQEIGRFIKAIDNDPELKGRIS